MTTQESRVNVAIIGAGIGRKHDIAYQALPELFDVRTICDTNMERARDWMPADRDTTITDDFDAVLADPAIELVDICLPPHLHFSFTERALRAGKDVICEKPLCTSVSDVDRLTAISLETGRRIFPVFQYRYGQGIAHLRALIDSGLAGRPFVVSLETHWNRGADYYAVDWRGTWAGEQGGAVLGHAIHAHDLLTFILGPIDSVFAYQASRVNDIEVEDCAALSIRLTSGALASSSVTLGAGDDTSRLRFCFEGVTAESGDLPYRPAEGNWRFTARAPVTQEQVDAVIAATPETAPGQIGFSRDVYNALRGRPSNCVDIEAARRSIEFVSAVYHSARQNEPVQLPIEVGHPTYDGWLPTS